MRKLLDYLRGFAAGVGQCGYSARGCRSKGTGGWHSCDRRPPAHSGSHHCAYCGSSF